MSTDEKTARIIENVQGWPADTNDTTYQMWCRLLVKEIERLQEYEWMYKDLCK